MKRRSLADRIVRGEVGLFAVHPELTPETRERLIDLRAEVLARLRDSQVPKVWVEPHAGCIPNSGGPIGLSPFPVMWMEIGWWAVLCHRMPVDEADWPHAWDFPDTVHHVMYTQVIACDADTSATILPLMVVSASDREGNALLNNRGSPGMVLESFDGAFEKFGRLVTPSTFFCNYVFSLCAAKNAKLVDGPIDTRTRAERRRGDAPYIRFKRLTIAPAFQSRGGRHDRDERYGVPLHLCRGHFKDYRESSGLFGKLKGLYWFDAHARGSADVGVVEKEYVVRDGQSAAV